MCLWRVLGAGMVTGERAAILTAADVSGLEELRGEQD